MRFKRVRFGELLAEPTRNGLNRPKRVRGSGLPMVNMGELFSYPRIKDNEMDLVPVSEHEMHYALQPGDLLFARQSLVPEGAGRCAIFLGNSKPTVFESHLIRCRLNTKLCNPHYYYYFFRSRFGRSLMSSIVEQGAGVAGIRASDLVKLEVPLPPKHFQTQVATLLSMLDDRIDLLRYTNMTLESIARAIFKSWFIDFDPVHAKAAGREPEGMDAETAALFPSEFVESELGPIPKGWRQGKYGELATLVRGSVRPSNSPEVLFEHYSLPAYDSGQVPVRERGSEIKSSKTPVRSGTVLQSKLNPHIPRVWLPGVVGLNAVCSTEFLVWLPSGDLSRLYVYCLLKSRPFVEMVRALATGTSNSHQRVRPDQVSDLPVIIPSPKVIRRFHEVVAPLFARVIHNREQARLLVELRDALLPRLISGKLRIPEAEEVVQEAVS